MSARVAAQFAGCVQATKSRQTKTLILVVNGEEANVDTDGGRQPWSTICNDHGHIVSHETLALAKAHAADPLGWCEECMRICGVSHNDVIQ